MKCPFCEFETEEEEDFEGLDRHIHRVHPEEVLSPSLTIDLLRFHYEFNIDIDQLVDDCFTMRTKLGRRLFDERFGNPFDQVNEILNDHKED